MLNHIFVSYGEPDFNKPGYDIPGAAFCPVLLLEPAVAALTASAYQYCSENIAQPFSISVFVNTPLPPAFTNQLISFFFMPSYCRINQQRIMFLTGAQIDLLDAARETILQQASRQGIDNLLMYSPELYVPGMAVTPQNEAGYLFTDSAGFTDYYQAFMKTNQPYNHIFYLQHAGPLNGAGLQSLAEAINTAECHLKTNQPGLYELAAEMQMLLNDHETLKKKYQAAENEINNYKSHLEIMRSAHQAKELQEYYNNEYEVLPLWFKRLGHIVKVITGKRHFRSLFSDNVKKYKD